MHSVTDYWRNSIVDAERLSPDGSALANARSRNLVLSSDAFLDGLLPRATTDALFTQIGNSKDNAQGREGRPKAIDVLLCPIVFVTEVGHGVAKGSAGQKVLAPIRIPARLAQTGALSRASGDHIPQINRDFLEPSGQPRTIGSLDDADAFYTREPAPGESWNAVVAYTEKLIEFVTKQSFDRLTLADSVRLELGLVLSGQSSGAAKSIVEGYDRLAQMDALPQLLRLLIDGVPEGALLDQTAQFSYQARHVGQMGKAFELTDSQREAITHFLSVDPDTPDILAVNGPPGTGKTTLLQSVVATLWVQAALGETDAPVIVAASANNQAITNVIDAFSGGAGDDSEPLSGRWLADVKDLGMYMPSRSADRGGRQVYLDKDDYFAKSIETAEGLERNSGFFLQCFKRAFPENTAQDLQAAKVFLHEKLSEVREGLKRVVDLVAWLSARTGGAQFTLAQSEAHYQELEQAWQTAVEDARATDARLVTLNRLKLEWTEHQSGEPFWMSLLSFIGPVRKRRELYDRSFILRKHAKDELGEIDETASRPEVEEYLRKAAAGAEVNAKEAERNQSRLQNELSDYQNRHEQLSIWCRKRQIEAPALADIWRSLDIVDRHRMFLLAMHYWEAAYLLEVGEDLASGYEDKKSPAKLRRMFQRLSKLTPCFVATFHMLPKHFTGWLGKEPKITEQIDLLVVDEAGQAAPETSALSFAFAKHALVVGDVKQIKPIRQIPEAVDRSNVARFIGAGEAAYDDVCDRGLSVSTGTLMAMAQKASRYTAAPNLGRGMLLREHFRCLDDIIAYCNVLAYEGELIPKRGVLDREHPLPALGFANIDAEDSRSGGSRHNPDEAEVIAAWVLAHCKELSDYYGKAEQDIGDLLAVVTPFSAQVQSLRQKLRKAGLPIAGRGQKGITVGTLHALQGAERRIVLFSPTYGREHRGSTFFGSDPEMLNVAVSRAQDSFLVFGNMRLFDRSASGKPARLLGRMILDQQNEITDVQPVAILKDAPPRNELINDLERHREVLQEAFRSAVTDLAIVSPYLTLRALNDDEIEQRVLETTARGVRVSIFTDRFLNEEKRPKEFHDCLKQLMQAGAEIYVAETMGIHSKLLWFDRQTFVNGSFNWLSAVRSDSKYRRYEVSSVYRGESAAPFIRRAGRDLHTLCTKLDEMSER